MIGRKSKRFMGHIGPKGSDFLKNNNYKVIKNPLTNPSYILIEDIVKVKGK